ncbi:glycosyltransferase [Campylobacter armoricus]|uniref:glycosyltransferase n=1 Tax=Campylobacter armoricus TaxID=2505970 RepID=UPI001117A8D7|nr:glycosyltransferase [Campylobacter armoricus]
MKQTISSFWYTPKGYKGIGLMELLSIKSFLDNGYKFELYTYNLDDRIFNKLNEIFDNFELKDANEIIPFKNYFSDDRGAGVAAFSDYFRFNMLYLRGGVWVDLDMICLNYLDLNQEYVFSQEIDEDETKPRITTSFLKFPQYSDFGKNLIQEANKIINNQKIIEWGAIGPWFLANQVKKMGLESFAWDYKMTCQISYLEAKNFIDPNKNIDTTQPFLHLFSEIWNTYHINKNHFYKKGIYADLLKKHEIMDLTKKLDFEFSFKDKYYPLFSILFYAKYYIKHPRRIFIKNKRI